MSSATRLNIPTTTAPWGLGHTTNTYLSTTAVRLRQVRNLVDQTRTARTSLAHEPDAPQPEAPRATVN
jgi:hypothetical protein